MKCFVATAVGKNDVDAIFDKAIRPVLRELHIRVLRVDRIEHNDDIDDKIFALLDDADFCIADLTYARPSVYYEAGYAFGRSKPVIYTSRSDHFKDHPKDPFGIHRVHFDLQMKNIIPWNSPSNTLRIRLRRRIRHIVGPLQRASTKTKKEIASEQLFAQYSQYNKFANLTAAALGLCRVRGYKTDGGGEKKSTRRFMAENFDGTISKRILFQCVNSLPRSMFDSVYLFPLLASSKGEAKTVDAHFVIAALRNKQATRLGDIVPGFSPTANGAFVRGRTSPKGTKEITTIHVLDGIKSVESFSARFRDLLGTFKLAKG